MCHYLEKLDNFKGELFTCENSASFCQNGGKCVNQTTNRPNLGLVCVCTPGYSGDFCEIGKERRRKKCI